MTPMALSQGRLSTETPTFQDLIADIKKGVIKIPQFQRKFVWKEPQAFKLLDSVANNYPIGSLLIWKTAVKLASERNIGNFKLPQTDDMTPTDYVLDGQQRITVIYSSLGSAETDNGFCPGYDLEEREFVSMNDEETQSALVFPLRSLYHTTKVLNFRTGLQAHKAPEELQARLDELIDAFTKYKMPVVTLKDLTVDEVCPIFERINSSGTKLSVFDLMVAATWSQEFDLNGQVETIALSLKSKNFGKIDPNAVLKCLAAVRFSSIRQDQIINLRSLHKNEMSQLVTSTSESLMQAVDALTTEFGIHGWDFLPYEALLIILCYVYHRAGSPAQVNTVRLRQWFWRSAFSQRYRVGGENFVSKDLQDVCSFILDAKGKPTDFGTPPHVDSWAKTPFRASNSVSVAFILALASLKPRNLTNGALIDVAKALSQFNRKEFHHIHPKNHLLKSKTAGERNAVANICMLAASENKTISDEDPQKYLPAYALALGTGANSVFSSNLLPKPSEVQYSSMTFADFLTRRCKLIDKMVRTLCDGGHA
jgi:hypothetical protein